MTTNITIEKRIDDIIFNICNGIFKKGLNVDDNLINDENKTKIYLGTYFPRSYAEIHHILNDLFSNPAVINHYSDLNEVRILDIGSGTGGDLLGMIHSLQIHFPNINNFHVYTIDGNDLAINYLNFIMQQYNNNTFTNISITSKIHVFTNAGFENELNSIISDWGNIKFDFIISSKFFSEIYNKDPLNTIGLYSSFVNESKFLLKEKGLSIITDVTTKDRDSKRDYTPYIMNNEILNYIKIYNDEIRIILPLSCAFWYNSCSTNRCFSQMLFFINHSRARLDKSKICCFVFAKPDFSDSILNSITPENKYNICFKEKGCDGYCDRGRLVNSYMTSIKSAFILN